MVGRFCGDDPHFWIFNPIGSLFYTSTLSDWPPLSAEEIGVSLSHLVPEILGPKVGLIYRSLFSEGGILPIYWTCHCLLYFGQVIILWNRFQKIGWIIVVWWGTSLYWTCHYSLRKYLVYGRGHCSLRGTSLNWTGHSLWELIPVYWTGHWFLKATPYKLDKSFFSERGVYYIW